MLHKISMFKSKPSGVTWGSVISKIRFNINKWFNDGLLESSHVRFSHKCVHDFIQFGIQSQLIHTNKTFWTNKNQSKRLGLIWACIVNFILQFILKFFIENSRFVSRLVLGSNFFNSNHSKLRPICKIWKVGLLKIEMGPKQ